MKKVFVYGVDGGSYPLINSFVEQGYLPNYKRMIENGCFGKFISTVPPHTAPGWTSISTGVNPGIHGIYQFWKTNGTQYIGNYQGSKEWQVSPVWKILNSYGYKTGVINVPMTHPPTELDGFMLSWPLSNTLNYSYPKSLLKEIIGAGGHFSPDIYVMYTGQKDYLKTACDITKKRLKTIQYLIQNKEWDFFMTVFPEVDRISHYYWQFTDQNSPYFKEDEELRNAVLEMYIKVDKTMGAIVDSLPEDTLFISLSDHGFRLGEIDFNINTFLVEKGYMKLKKVEDDKDSEMDQEGNNWFRTTWYGQKYEVDWSQTQLFISAPGSYGVNYNLKRRQCDGIVKEQEKEKLFQQLRKDLLEVRHPFKDRTLFRDIVKGNEVYKGKSEELAPDILLIPEDYSTMVSHHLKMDELFSEPEQKGMHCRDGYILFYGNSVQRGKQLSDCQIEDFTPTVLKYFGIPIPEYVEGTVIDSFTDGFGEKIREYQEHNLDEIDNRFGTSYSEEESNDIEQRLRGLGYL